MDYTIPKIKEEWLKCQINTSLAEFLLREQGIYNPESMIAIWGEHDLRKKENWYHEEMPVGDFGAAWVIDWAEGGIIELHHWLQDTEFKHAAFEAYCIRRRRGFENDPED